MTNSHENLPPGSQRVVALPIRAMTVPHRTPPATRSKAPSEPSEVVDLKAPWAATDRLVGLQRQRAADTMRALMTIMDPDAARERVRQATLDGICDALKAEIKECGND